MTVKLSSKLTAFIFCLFVNFKLAAKHTFCFAKSFCLTIHIHRKIAALKKN